MNGPRAPAASGSSRSPTFEREIDAVVQRFGAGWEALRDARLFITGGTGYFGRWLLRTLARADQTLGLDLRATVLTRSPERFLAIEPELRGSPVLRLCRGDVRSFEFPDGEFTHLVHGATTSAEATYRRIEDPLTKFDTTLEGTRRALDFAASRRIPRLLMLSSGSYYGPLAAGQAAYREDDPGAPAPDNLAAAIGHAKRAAEFLCACHAQRHALSFSTARCFSFVGPHLPLDLHYAVGNFIRDALWGEAITVAGDGTPVRSYMYTGDLIVWLLTLLVRGANGRAYNVGSDRPVTIAQIARQIGELLAPDKEVRVLGERRPSSAATSNVYLPDIERARTELGLEPWTPLEEAIRLTAASALETSN